MIQGRIKEIIDFATSESPYQDANKGWLNDDIYLQLGGTNASSSRKNEVANIAIFWEPINKIISLLFLIIASSAIFVFVATAYSHNKIDFISGLQPQITSISKIDTSIKQEENESNLEQGINIDSSSQLSESTVSKGKSAAIISKDVKPAINPLLPKSH